MRCGLATDVQRVGRFDDTHPIGFAVKRGRVRDDLIRHLQQYLAPGVLENDLFG